MSGQILATTSVCSSPHLKANFLEPTPRSRSSDNLEKYSPLVGRRSQGDSPLTASPLARRLAGQEGCTEGDTPEENNDSGNQETDAAKGLSKLKPTSTTNSLKPSSPTVLPSVRLRSTGLADSLRSPTNGFPKTDIPKSPILKSIIKDTSSKPAEPNPCCPGKQCLTAKVKPPPPIAPKPRPWSVAGNDRKSGEFVVNSDGSSSTNTSAANTPDSGDALDESTDSGVASLGSGEKKSVRELAACLNKNGPSEKRGETDTTESKTVDSASGTPVPSPKEVAQETTGEARRRERQRRRFFAPHDFPYEDDVVNV